MHTRRKISFSNIEAIKGQNGNTSAVLLIPREKYYSKGIS